MRKYLEKINLPLLSLSYFALFSLAIVDNAKSPIYPNLLKLFSLNHNSGAWIFVLPSIMGILATSTSSFWIKKFGIINAKRFFISILLSGTTAMIFSLNLYISFALFIIGTSMIGLSMGGMSITMNLLIDEAVPAEYRRKSFSGLHSLYGLASFFAPAVLILIIKLNYEWKQLFNFLILFPLLLFIYAYRKDFFIIKNKAHSDPNFLGELDFKKTIPFALMLSFYVCSEVTISSRFRVFSQHIWGINQETSNTYLALFFGFLTLGRIVFVFFETKSSNRKLLLISLAGSVIFYFLGIKTHPLFLSLIGLSMSFYFPCALDLISESFTKNLNRALPFCLNLVAIKLLATHFIIGYFTEMFGPWAIVSISLPMLLIAMLFLLKTKFVKLHQS